MSELTPAERQLLVCLRDISKRDDLKHDREAIFRRAAQRFKKKQVDLSPAFESLAGRGWLRLDPTKNTFTLGDSAVVVARDLDWEFSQSDFSNWLLAFEKSSAYQAFCREAYRTEFVQFNMVDQGQMDRLLDLLALDSGHRVVDLGCGVGMQAEYLSDRTGAHVTGIDFAREAVARANQRTEAKRSRLGFELGNLNALALPPHAFDVALAFDSLYFVDDLDQLVVDVFEALVEGGRFMAFYSELRRPSDPPEILDPTRTRLGAAIRAHRMKLEWIELTEQEEQFWQRSLKGLLRLESAFAEEGNRELWQSNLDEAKEMVERHKNRSIRRYLYSVTV